MKRTLVLIFAGLLILMASSLNAATLKGITYPDEITVEGSSLTLQGLGLRSKFFFKVYVGALYLTEPTSDDKSVISSNTAKRISMTMMRDVDAKSITDAYRDGAKANAPEGYEKIAGKFEKFLSFYEGEVKEGDVMELTYIPSKGTNATLNGKDLGTIEGADFMEVLFSIWFGPKPPNDDLKEGMLGK